MGDSRTVGESELRRLLADACNAQMLAEMTSHAPESAGVFHVRMKVVVPSGLVIDRRAIDGTDLMLSLGSEASIVFGISGVGSATLFSRVKQLYPWDAESLKKAKGLIMIIPPGTEIRQRRGSFRVMAEGGSSALVHLDPGSQTVHTAIVAQLMDLSATGGGLLVSAAIAPRFAIGTELAVVLKIAGESSKLQLMARVARRVPKDTLHTVVGLEWVTDKPGSPAGRAHAALSRYIIRKQLKPGTFAGARHEKTGRPIGRPV